MTAGTAQSRTSRSRPAAQIRGSPRKPWPWRSCSSICRPALPLTPQSQWPRRLCNPPLQCHPSPFQLHLRPPSCAEPPSEPDARVSVEHGLVQSSASALRGEEQRTRHVHVNFYGLLGFEARVAVHRGYEVTVLVGRQIDVQTIPEHLH